MGKKVLLLFLAIGLVAGLGGVIGCKEAKGITAIDLVPQTADIAATINLNRIFADDDVLDVVNEIAASLEEPKTVDELLDEIEQETGIDLRDFSEVLIFSDFESENYFGLIIKGDFDQAALIDSIESAVGEELSPSDYRGYQIYSFDSDEAAICFLNSDTVLGGSRVAVKDAIDVKKGASPLSGPVYQTYNALGDAWVKAALEMPTEAVEEFAEEVPLALEGFRNIQAIGISFNKVGVNLSFQLKLVFPSSETAAEASEAIDALVGLVSFIPEIPSEVTEILNRLNVSQAGSWVTISFAATKAEIRGWAQTLGDIFGED